jgi:dienelactone hydrolase
VAILKVIGTLAVSTRGSRLIIVWFALMALFPTAGLGQSIRVELHPLSTTTLSDQEYLTGIKESQPTIVAGELRLPGHGSDRLPTVVLIHSSGGVGARETSWASHLNKLGIATFTIDSFTGRGLTNTGENQALLGRLAMIVGAYRGLGSLAKHPRIDPSRIALMGFSRGAQTTLYASLKRFRRMHSPAGIEFAAYLPFYANCSTTYIDDVEVSDRPIRIFHGSADDYNPVSVCRAYVDRLRAAGKDVQIFEYPAAHHMFDNPAAPPPRHFPRNQTTRNCTLQENPLGQIINTKTNQPFTYEDSCVERGVTMGFSREAYAKALSDVTELLKAIFKFN